jgi:hypothetical protein
MAQSKNEPQSTQDDPQTENNETTYLKDELDRLGVVSEAHQFGKQDYNLDRSK